MKRHCNLLSSLPNPDDELQPWLTLAAGSRKRWAHYTSWAARSATASRWATYRANRSADEMLGWLGVKGDRVIADDPPDASSAVQLEADAPRC